MRGDVDQREVEVLVSRGMMAFVASMNAMGFSVGREGIAYIKAWFEFYYRWPGRRVVGFTEPEQIAAKLLADSFAFQAVGDMKRPLRAIDLGSGNGWPGLAVRLSVPESNVTLMDSRLGAYEFMTGLLEAAPLEGTSVILRRAEDSARDPALWESCGLVVSRAMASPAVALELCAPFASLDGRVILWLGPEQEETVVATQSIPEIGLSLSGLLNYSLPSGLGRRIIGVYGKTSHVKPGFPRRYSNITKKPLF